jgi:hypothetical protein
VLLQMLHLERSPVVGISQHILYRYSAHLALHVLLIVLMHVRVFAASIVSDKGWLRVMRVGHVLLFLFGSFLLLVLSRRDVMIGLDIGLLGVLHAEGVLSCWHFVVFGQDRLGEDLVGDIEMLALEETIKFFSEEPIAIN